MSEETPIEEIHEKKIVGYLLSGGNLDYISKKNGADWSEIDLKHEDALFEKMYEDGDSIKKLENQLLKQIAMPSNNKTMGEVFSTVNDKHSKRILTFMTGGEWKNYEQAGASELNMFLSKYPTPMELEDDATRFLTLIQQQNGDDKSREYNEAMGEFCQKIYGKRYEYYKAMKRLDRDAEEHNMIFHRETAGEAQEALKLEAGGYSLNKAYTIDPGAMNVERPNEDAMYINEEKGIFGVFDGAGGVGGADLASGTAAKVVESVAENYDVNTTEGIKNMLIFANQAVNDTEGAGCSTAVVGKIVKEKGQKKLIFGCVGDSRIYVVRNGDAYQITKDEGVGRYLANALGMRNKNPLEVVTQVGEVQLVDGDQLVFCSDGITGDKPEDFIPTKEMALTVMSATSPTEAAAALTRRATKKDDRTAVVVRV